MKGRQQVCGGDCKDMMVKKVSGTKMLEKVNVIMKIVQQISTQCHNHSYFKILLLGQF